MPVINYVTVTKEDVEALAAVLGYLSKRFEEVAVHVSEPVDVPNWKTVTRGVEYIKSGVNRIQATVEEEMLDKVKRPLTAEEIIEMIERNSNR